MRTHYCGLIDEALIGQTVTLCGWVNKIRLQAHVAFVADRNTVIETKNGCAQVRDGGILITLGPADGDDHEVRVAINGFVACLGATWLTYVVERRDGGWQVTGTTGSRAVA